MAPGEWGRGGRLDWEEGQARMTYATVECMHSFLFNKCMLCPYYGARLCSGAGDAVNQTEKSPGLKISGLGVTSDFWKQQNFPNLQTW